MNNVIDSSDIRSFNKTELLGGSGSYGLLNEIMSIETNDKQSALLVIQSSDNSNLYGVYFWQDYFPTFSFGSDQFLFQTAVIEGTLNMNDIILA